MAFSWAFPLWKIFTYIKDFILWLPNMLDILLELTYLLHIFLNMKLLFINYTNLLIFPLCFIFFEVFLKRSSSLSLRHKDRLLCYFPFSLWDFSSLVSAFLSSNTGDFTCYCQVTSDSATLWTVAWLLHPWDFPGKNTGAGCRFLLQGIFPTQGSNISCIGRWILYHWATRKAQWLGFGESTNRDQSY